MSDGEPPNCVCPPQFYPRRSARWPLSEPSCFRTSLTSSWETLWLPSTSFCISFLTCTLILSCRCFLDLCPAQRRFVFPLQLAVVLSCRYTRRDVLPLGKFTLNLSGCLTVASYTQRLYQIIQQLVPSVRYLCPSQLRY